MLRVQTPLKLLFSYSCYYSCTSDFCLLVFFVLDVFQSEMWSEFFSSVLQQLQPTASMLSAPFCLPKLLVQCILTLEVSYVGNDELLQIVCYFPTILFKLQYTLGAFFWDHSGIGILRIEGNGVLLELVRRIRSFGN